MRDRGFRYTGRWLRLLPAPHPSRPWMPSRSLPVFDRAKRSRLRDALSTSALASARSLRARAAAARSYAAGTLFHSTTPERSFSSATASEGSHQCRGLRRKITMIIATDETHGGNTQHGAENRAARLPKMIRSVMAYCPSSQGATRAGSQVRPGNEARHQGGTGDPRFLHPVAEI